MGRLTVRVAPGAARSEIVGRANEEVVVLVAAALGVPRAAPAPVRGGRARDKLVDVAGLERPKIEARLERHVR